MVGSKRKQNKTGLDESRQKKNRNFINDFIAEILFLLLCGSDKKIGM